MLHCSVFVDEERSSSAYSRLFGVVKQVFQPIPAHDFRIVIEENEKLAAGMADSGIVCAREIELAVEWHHYHSEFAHGLQRRRIGRIVIDHHDFNMRIRCLAGDALKTTTQHVRRVPGRDKNANEWERFARPRHDLEAVWQAR